MKSNKLLPYVIYGVPIAIGLYFLYKSIKSKKGSEEVKPTTEPTPATPTTPTTTPIKYTKRDTLPFKKGIESSYVGVIQRKLGLTDDNKFGNVTYNAVVNFQKSNGLTADGIVGKKTWKAIFTEDFPNTGAFPQYPPYVEEPIKKFDPFNIK